MSDFVSGDVQDLNVAGGAQTMDCSKSNVWRINGATGNLTVAITNTRPGQPVYLIFIQDGVGGRTLTVSNTLQLGVGALTPGAGAGVGTLYTFVPTGYSATNAAMFLAAKV